MNILVKIGGTLLDADSTREQLARQVAAAARRDRVVVVHGGGRQLTRYLADHGIESHFVNGLRVTSPKILDAVIKVVAGDINSQLVAALNREGARAAGVSGIDANLVEAVPLDPDLGSVGRITNVDPSLLHALLGGGFLPVVACVAGDRQGRFYNVNADQMAAACAVAFEADRLIFLTDVAGVLDSSGQVLPRLHIAESELLIAGGVAAGGMRAKLNAAHTALRQGVAEVRIACGSDEGILDHILDGDGTGTHMIS